MLGPSSDPCGSLEVARTCTNDCPFYLGQGYWKRGPGAAAPAALVYWSGVRMAFGKLWKLKVPFSCSPVAEGGASPPSEGLHQTKCTVAFWGRRFYLSILFKQIGGRFRDIGNFPLNGANVCLAEPIRKIIYLNQKGSIPA